MKRTLQDIWYALTSPEHYREFMNYKKGKLFLYVLVLVLIAGICNFAIPATRFMASGGFQALIEENIPEFYVNGKDGFWIEEPVEIDEYNILVKADSKSVKEDITDLDGQYGSYEYVLMIDPEQIYIKSLGMPEMTARFDELGDFSITKDDLISLVPEVYLVVIWVFLFMLLLDYGYYFLTAFVVSWGAGVIAIFMKTRISNKKMWKMAIYAGTLSYLLEILQGVFGISIPNFSLFSLIISTGYMFFAIREYKDSGIEELPPENFGNREG